MEACKKSELVAEFHANANGFVFSLLTKIINCHIDECHIANEMNRGDDFVNMQGQIEAYRKIIKLLNPREKTKES